MQKVQEDNCVGQNSVIKTKTNACTSLEGLIRNSSGVNKHLILGILIISPGLHQQMESLSCHGDRYASW